MSRVSTQNDLERHPTELSRIATARSQHNATVGASVRTTSRADRKPLPSMGAGKPYPPELPEMDEYVVEFDGPDDPLHAQNWPLRKKIITAAMLGYTTMTSAFTSSIFSSATMVVASKYGVSQEVGLLGTTFYVLGFAFGPTLWAPLSELKGRRLPLVVSMFGFSVFSIACATGKDIQTILLCRFFSGFFGACPLAVVAAVFSDMFDNKTRGIAVTLFSMAVFTGPLLAPFIGGFIVESHLGWRWTEYLASIMGFTAFALDLVFLEETYPPVILIAKAGGNRSRLPRIGFQELFSPSAPPFHRTHHPAFVYLHEFHLRSSVPFPDCLPACICWCPRFQHGAVWPYLLRHDHWPAHRRCIRYSPATLVHAQADCQQRCSCP